MLSSGKQGATGWPSVRSRVGSTPVARPVIYREALRARDEAKSIIRRAEAEAAKIRAEADSVRQKMATQAEEDRAALETKLVEVVVEAVRVLLAAELRSQPELIVQLVRRGLGLAADPEAKVKLHPEDLSQYPGGEADPELTRGSCIIESGGAEILCSPRTLSEGLRSVWVGP